MPCVVTATNPTRALASGLARWAPLAGQRAHPQQQQHTLAQHRARCSCATPSSCRLPTSKERGAREMQAHVLAAQRGGVGGCVVRPAAAHHHSGLASVVVLPPPPGPSPSQPAQSHARSRRRAAGVVVSAAEVSVSASGEPQPVLEVSPTFPVVALGTPQHPRSQAGPLAPCVRAAGAGASAGRCGSSPRRPQRAGAARRRRGSTGQGQRSSGRSQGERHAYRARCLMARAAHGPGPRHNATPPPAPPDARRQSSQQSS